MSEPDTIRPYDVGDRLTERELAARIGVKPRTLRDRRAKGTSPPYTMDGKRPIYSWTKYLDHMQCTERQPLPVKKGVTNETYPT